MTDTTEHAWSQEHIAAYVVGGLTALEAERLEAHVRDCPGCAMAVAATRRLDSGLASLFADVRPGPALEDRVVHRLRTTPRRPLLAGWVKRTMAAAAAVIILGTVGAFVGPAMATIPLPGQTAKRPASPSTIPITPPARDGYPAPITEDGGRDSDGDEAANKWFKSRMQSGNATDASLESDRSHYRRLDSYTVGAARTDDNIGQPNSLDLHGYALSGHGLMNADGSVRGINTNGSYNANLWGTFSGRSGATKELRLTDGGGQSVSELAFSPDGKKLAGITANPHYQSANRPVLIFNPAEHKPALFGMNAQPPEQKKDPADPKVQPPDNPKPQPKDPTPVVADPTKRVILRSGEMEFEVEVFANAYATVQKLVDGVKGAFVADKDEKKLANGKVKGSVTVRVPPEHLDGFVSALRKELDKNGGLKGVRISSSDVTKQYYDIESHLKAARLMEQRILEIIKDGKGDIKVLLEAEKQLGEWRTAIEKFEGEIRYYNNLAALSTLTITLTEKEIHAAASLIERERVQAGVEVQDVEKTYQQLLAAVADAKGRVSKSEMKQLTAGQFNATINFEVAPEVTGPVRDRLNQLGRVARLEIDRVQQAEGGTMPTDAKAKRGDTVFLVQLYNLANVAPRETATLQVAVVDVPTAYQALRDAVAKTTGRVLNAQLNEQDRQNVTAQLDFEVRRSDEAAVRVALDGAGEVVARQVARAAEGENVTDTKVMYRVALLAANRLKPREVTTLGIEVADVDAAAASFAVQVNEAKGRLVDSKTTREQNGRVVAKLVYEVPLSAAATLAERFKSAGTVRVSQSVRDPQASDGRFATARLDVTLSNTEGIVAADAGVWQQVRRGLSYSASVLLTSVTWVVFGLCVVLPWAVIGYGGYRVARRAVRNSRTDTPTVPPGPTVA